MVDEERLEEKLEEFNIESDDPINTNITIEEIEELDLDDVEILAQKLEFSIDHYEQIILKAETEMLSEEDLIDLGFDNADYLRLKALEKALYRHKKELRKMNKEKGVFAHLPIWCAVIGILVFVIAGFYTIIETMITDYPIFTIALSSLIVGLILFFCIRRLAWGIRKTWVCKHARNAFIDLCGCLPERKIKNLSKDHRSILLSYRKSRWRKLEDVCLKSSNQEKQQENLFDFFSKSGNDSTHWEITRSIMEIQNAKDICGWIRNAHSNFSM